MVIIAAMGSSLHAVSAGTGPRVLLIHGSAADHTTWSIQLASEALCARFTLIAYDRREDVRTVEAHAADAAALLGDDLAGTLVIGSSFGAVIALELIRQRPARGAILIEPPMAAAEAASEASRQLLAAFDRTVAERGGPAAADLFLRTVLGDAAFERMPRVYRERAEARWRQIRADSEALIAYRPRFRELASVTTPVLLLGGERSATYFRPTLIALARHLPRAWLEVIPRAGHMLHAEAHRRFADLVIALGLALP
jgi:pimeloyl-ACP methyl ester carboxylesterase